MNTRISICKNCFNFAEYCKCDNSTIINLPLTVVKFDFKDAVEQLLDVLVDDELVSFVKDYNTFLPDNQFEIRKENQITLLYRQFIYDCLPFNGQYNDLEKSKHYEGTGKCPWLHWKPLNLA